MAGDDWYRGQAWDEPALAAFEEKLGRARSHTRPQYLRIKGLELTASGSDDVRAAGRGLLRRVVDEHPGDDRPARARRNRIAVRGARACLGR